MSPMSTILHRFGDIKTGLIYIFDPFIHAGRVWQGRLDIASVKTTKGRLYTAARDGMFSILALDDRRAVMDDSV
jgi:hypothetical protein